MVIQFVPLNIVKDGGMFWCGLRKRSVCYNSYNGDGSSGPWILNGLLSSFLDKCWYLSWWKRDGIMAMDVPFNLGSEQLNRTNDTKQDISQSKNQRERKIASKWHVCSSFFLFPFYFTPGNINWGNLWVESSSAAFFRYRENACSSENIWKICLKCFFSPNL